MGREHNTLLGGELRRAFTLVEVLVVMAIVGLVAAMLLPAVQAGREASRRAQCASQLRQVGLALAQYESLRGVFPAAFTRRPDHNVLTFLLPHLEQQTVYDRFDLASDWSAAANRAARDVDLGVFVCPTAPTGRRYVSDFAAGTLITSSVRNPLVAAGLIRQRSDWTNLFSATAGRCTAAAEVRDGLSQSFMLFECAGRPQSWRMGQLEPGRTVTGAAWADDQAPFWVHSMCNGAALFGCSNNNEIYAFHPAGANFLYGDASVHFHVQEMAPDVFVSLFTKAAGD